MAIEYASQESTDHIGKDFAEAAYRPKVRLFYTPRSKIDAVD
jgi:hypothetical protein